MTRKGFTLGELLVVLAILAVIAGVSAFGLSNALGPTMADAPLGEARDSAIRTGRRVLAVDSSGDGAPRMSLFLPDGRVIGPAGDPLTGADVRVQE